jgi:hypothetical protein
MPWQAEEVDEEEEESLLLEMACHLGCQVSAVVKLPQSVRWIIEKSLEAPLPESWSEAADSNGAT